ncbi:MAG: hypothetical protein C4293_19695 [Nitrospiraceae bacterium]
MWSILRFQGRAFYYVLALETNQNTGKPRGPIHGLSEGKFESGKGLARARLISKRKKGGVSDGFRIT